MRTRLVSACAVVLLAVAFVAALPSGHSADAATREDEATITKDEAFVMAAYADFLHRAPTEEELAEETAEPLDTVAARQSLVDRLAHSPEWIAVTVDQLYVDTLGRPADEDGAAFWAEVLGDGDMTVAQAAANFYSSDEYFEGFGNGNVEDWITDLYAKILLRTVDQPGLDFWVDATDLRGRWWVAHAFYQTEESCHTRVEHLYQVLLGRDPETAGWNYWSDRVEEFGDLILAAHLASSVEYYERAWVRFGPPPTTTTTTVDETSTSSTSSTSSTTTTSTPPVT